MKLEEIEELIRSATPGPWKLGVSHAHHSEEGKFFEVEGPDQCEVPSYIEEDAKFIAASRILMPKLLAVAKAAISARDSGYDPDGFCDTQDRIRAMRGLWEALQELERE